MATKQKTFIVIYHMSVAAGRKAVKLQASNPEASAEGMKAWMGWAKKCGKKLVDMGYIHQQRSRADRRSVRISLTDEGKNVAKTVDALYERHTHSLQQIGQIDSNGFAQLNNALQRLERFWTDQILYRL